MPLGRVIIVVGITLTACKNPSDILPTTAHGQVEGVVVNTQGQPVSAADVTIRAARASLPYTFNADSSDMSGRFSIVVKRVAGAQQTIPDTVTYFVVGTLRPPASGQTFRDSVPVIVQFGPPDRSAPIATIQLQLRTVGGT